MSDQERRNRQGTESEPSKGFATIPSGDVKVGHQLHMREEEKREFKTIRGEGNNDSNTGEEEAPYLVEFFPFSS